MKGFSKLQHERWNDHCKNPQILAFPSLSQYTRNPTQSLTCWSPDDPLHQEAGWSTQAASGWEAGIFIPSDLLSADIIFPSSPPQDISSHPWCWSRTNQAIGNCQLHYNAFHLTSVLMGWIIWIKQISLLEWDFLLGQWQWDICLLTSAFQQKFFITILFFLLTKESLLFKPSRTPS